MGNPGKQKRSNRNVTIQTPEDEKVEQNRPKSTVARGQKNKGVPSSTPTGNQDGGVLYIKKEN